MKTRTTAEMAIMCTTGLIALALVLHGSHGALPHGKAAALIVIGLSLVVGIVAWSRYLTTKKWSRYLTTKKRAQVEPTGGQQYRQLADEYRRLADLAITAQEHTDLKLGQVSAQLDYLREQTESLQKILKEVE
jgi:hypothetical protein